MAMGTALFFIFLAIIFVVALFFIVLNSIFIIIWNVKKHRGKPVKKRWLVIPVVFLIINGILMLFPVGFVIFLRIANSSARPEIVYAPSGKVLYWIEDEMGSIPSFELDEVKYVHIQDARSDDPFVIKYDETQLEEPIANIKYNKKDSDSFNNFMSWLLDGISYEEERTSTLYSITNENSFLLYYVKNWQGRLYCAENDLENIKSYYRNLAHYNTQDIHIEYTLYSDGEPSYERIKKTIILKPEVFEHLSELYHSQENHEPMRIPEKYNEILLAEKLGTSTSGLSTRDLYAYSTDDMAYQRIHLSMIDNQVYATGKLVISGSEIIDFAGSPLPAELNQYIIDVVFTE